MTDLIATYHLSFWHLVGVCYALIGVIVLARALTWLYRLTR